ncbi:hypothetical protein DVA67_030810 [Solirubrobacter sp. CPCC 204708]|nr:hypothetical protein [Solirubrobacter deserti]
MAAGFGMPAVALANFSSDLFEYIPDDQNGNPWNAYDLTQQVPGSPPISNPAAIFHDNRISVYGTTSQNGGSLIEYTSDQANNRVWNAYNISAAMTGIPAVRDPAALVDRDGLSRVYATTAQDHLIEVLPGENGGRLTTYADLTQNYGLPAVRNPTVVQMPNGIHRVYGTAANGDLYEMLPNWGVGWHAANLTARAPRLPPVRSPKAIVDAQGLPRIYATSNSGDLFEVRLTSLQGSWEATNITAHYNGIGNPNPAMPPVRQPTAVLDSNGMPHVYAVSSEHGTLFEVVPNHADNRTWNAYNLSNLMPFVGRLRSAPAAALDGQGRIRIHVTATGNQLIEMLPDGVGGRPWNAYNLSNLADGMPSSGRPAPVLAPNGQGQGRTSQTRVYIGVSYGGLDGVINDSEDVAELGYGLATRNDFQHEWSRLTDAEQDYLVRSRGPYSDTWFARLGIYHTSWVYGGTNHSIDTDAEIAAVRTALGDNGYRNGPVWDGIAPSDQPRIYPTSWSYGGADHRIATDDLRTAFDAFGSVAGSGAEAFLGGMAPSDQLAFHDYMAQRPVIFGAGTTLTTDEGMPGPLTQTALEITDDDLTATAAGGAPNVRCVRTTRTRPFFMDAPGDNDPQMGTTTHTIHWCYNRRKQTTSWDRENFKNSLDSDMNLKYTALGYKVTKLPPEDGEFHDVRNWTVGSTVYPKGQVAMSRWFDVDFCAGWVDVGVNCDPSGRLYHATYGRWDSTVHSVVANR